MEERSSAPGAELEVQDLVEEEEKSPGNVSNESAPSSSAPNNIEDILDTDIPPSNRNTRETESAEPSSPTDSQFFECNICYDPVRQPVVTLCGHLFWYVVLDTISLSNVVFQGSDRSFSFFASQFQLALHLSRTCLQITETNMF